MPSPDPVTRAAEEVLSHDALSPFYEHLNEYCGSGPVIDRETDKAVQVIAALLREQRALALEDMGGWCDKAEEKAREDSGTYDQYHPGKAHAFEQAGDEARDRAQREREGGR